MEAEGSALEPHEFGLKPNPLRQTSALSAISCEVCLDRSRSVFPSETCPIQSSQEIAENAEDWRREGDSARGSCDTADGPGSYSVGVSLRGRHQCGPVAAECPLQPERGGDEDVRLPGLDLLQRADIQIGKLGQSLLRHPSKHSLTAQIRPESGQFLRYLSIGRHAPSCRETHLRVTARCAVF